MRQSKSMWALGIGLIAGGAAGYYLATENGRAFRKKISDQVNNLQEQVRTTVAEKASNLGNTISNAADNAKNWVSGMADKAKETISYASDSTQNTVEEAEDSFKKGANRAKSNLENKSKSVQG